LRERQKDRKTERQKDRKTERQKDRKTERQKDRKTERQKDRKTERQKDRKQFHNCTPYFFEICIGRVFNLKSLSILCKVLKDMEKKNWQTTKSQKNNSVYHKKQVFLCYRPYFKLKLSLHYFYSRPLN
jgi:hypothetical protein